MLSAAAITLWLVTIAIAAFSFVPGVAPDERTTEMRDLPGAVQSIVDSVNAADTKQVARAARASGMAAAADVNPLLMAKLSLAFKELGLSVHKRFDEIATEADSDASRERTLASLGTQLSACVACHARYRIEAIPAAK